MLAPAVVSELVYKCDVVYHLAAAVGVRLIVEQPVHTLVTNVQGTEIVLDYCNRRQARTDRVQLRGVRRPSRGAAAARERPARVRPDHRTPLAVRGLEGAGRVPGARATTRSAALECVIARLFNTVGPRQSAAVRDGDPELRPGAQWRARCWRCTATERRRAPSATSRTRFVGSRVLMDDRSISGEIYNVGSTEQDPHPRPRATASWSSRARIRRSRSSRMTASTG